MTKTEALVKRLREMDDDERAYILLQLYGSNMVTNFKRLLGGIKQGKSGVIKKAYKDFNSIIGAIDKKMKEIM
jgi:hypothetical protein|tara:strand:+ start:282 stop:500 length:219 start_codon:yes stop_codon:yes gene_type:complete